jgi:hypothetical protein
MTTAEHINGVARDRYGVWCEHDLRVMVPNPADTSPYPGCVPADPWPCTACTPEDLEREDREIAAMYEAERWAEYREMTT